MFVDDLQRPRGIRHSVDADLDRMSTDGVVLLQRGVDQVMFVVHGARILCEVAMVAVGMTITSAETCGSGRARLDGCGGSLADVRAAKTPNVSSITE